MVESGTVEGARALLQAVCAINPATSRIRDQVDHTVIGRAWWMTPGPWDYSSGPAKAEFGAAGLLC